jgi:hypothetical protein
VKALVFLLFFILFLGYSTNKLTNAEFTNTPSPMIKMNDATYVMTEEILPADNVEEQIGKITKINTLVSYPPDKDPYENPSRIFKVKDIEIEDAIAIEVNFKLYKAE